ncbi:MAG: molybdopterin-dependent oxidoreductase [Deltaproteobacteria bacterium]|nr:molybdopterin-dependent oxidoreductase [Deltaproteobacteria bacterium]
MENRFRVLSTRPPRLDAAAKVTGQAVYTDDIKLPGMLYGALVQSPVGHARINKIDVTKAGALPGVEAVVTADDAPDVWFGVSPARYDEKMFVRDKVLYFGDEIAAVAAVDRETALKAAELVEIDYEELPVILDARKALEQGAVQIHEKYPGNVSAEVSQEFGDVEAAKAAAQVVKNGVMENEMTEGAFLEPQAVVANYDLHGNLTLYSSTQSVHYVQRIVAMVLGLSIGKVRVVKPYVGGGFGPKAGTSTLELAACFLSMKTGKPVKMTFSREQVFLHSRGRHKFVHQMEIGTDKEGRLLYLDHHALLDGGAYSSFGIATVYYAGSLLGGPYKLPNMRYHGIRAVTNKPASGAQRGHGGVVARALFERLMDELAEELDMDPMELRLKNMMEAGDVTCNDFNMSSLGMKECIEAVRDGSNWKEKRGNLSKGKGIGMSCGFFVSGAGYPIYRSDTFHSTAQIKLQEDGGTVLLETASAEIGQGSDTALAMIAAEALGIPLDAVRVLSGDTDYGVDLGAYSSRQTLMSGHAVKEAAESVRAQVLDVVGNILGIPADDLTIEDGLILHREGRDLDIAGLRTKYTKEHRGWSDNPKDGPLTFREASRLAFLEKGTIVGTGKYKPPPLGGKYKGATVGTSPAYGCSAQVVEVSVDMETGRVSVDRMTDAHDCGRAINKTSVEGQMQGSLSMGLGEALLEAVKFDEKGRVLNANLADYKIPTSMDMPCVNTVVVETNEPNGPFGAKEVGEGAIMPTIPAILNALYDAIGVRFEKVPVTAEEVLRAIKGEKTLVPKLVE